MPLPQHLKNACFREIQENGLDPDDSFWTGQTFDVEGGQEALIFGSRGRFEFGFVANAWRYHFWPAPSSPFDAGNAGSWDYEWQAVRRWLSALRLVVAEPDLWAELRRERAILAQPGAAGDAGNNTPFTHPELERVSQQIGELKQYVRESADLTGEHVRELEARLDYVERAAQRMGRVDWWNLFAGALINLVLSSVIPPHAVQSLLVLAARGLAGLFGGGPPQLLA